MRHMHIAKDRQKPALLLVVNQMDAMHDCHQVGHPSVVCHLLVHIHGADGVNGHAALQCLGVGFGQ